MRWDEPSLRFASCTGVANPAAWAGEGSAAPDGRLWTPRVLLEEGVLVAGALSLITLQVIVTQ